MEQNEKNAETSTQEQSAGGCGCGCGGGKGSNKIVVAIWVVLLLGFACVLAYTRSNGQNKADQLLQDAYSLYERQDFAGAADLLRQSAELGNPWAQIYYGGCLKQGSGVAADPAAAVEWYRKPRAWGRGEAQGALWRVSVSKANDLFAHQRYREAVEILKKTAEEGYSEAQACYAACLMNASGVNPDPFAAVAWFRKAAEQQNPTAIYSLGVCYENGEGVDRNLDTALEWYHRAKDAGLEDAQSAIIRVEKLKALKEAEK